VDADRGRDKKLDRVHFAVTLADYTNSNAGSRRRHRRQATRSGIERGFT
jgi:hypothetical protein